MGAQMPDPMRSERHQDDSLFGRRDEVIQHLIDTANWKAAVRRTRPDDFGHRITVADQGIDGCHRRGDFYPSGVWTFFKDLQENPCGVAIKKVSRRVLCRDSFWPSYTRRQLH